MEALYSEAKLIRYNKKILSNGLRQKREVDSGWLGVQRSRYDKNVRIHIGKKNMCLFCLYQKQNGLLKHCLNILRKETNHENKIQVS